MKQKLHYSGLLSLLLFLWACKKDPPLPDPCSNFVRPVADFRMYVMPNADQMVRTFDTFFLPEQIDTLYYHPYGSSTGTVYFKNTSNFTSSLKWTVGGDVRTFTEPNFFLRFGEPTGAGETIDVEMRTQRNVSSSPCYPNDDGLDTVRKSFFHANALAYKQPQLGRFKGYIKGQERDTFTVNIELYQTQPNTTGDYVISNFPKGATRGSHRLRPKVADELIFVGQYFLVLSTYGFDEFNQSGLQYCIGYAKKDSLFIEYKHRNGLPINFVGVRQ